MRINHNIAALNTYRQLGAANNGQMKSMEKLSSGLRINRAGDDAAGLAISEKMRGQIRGLEMAQKNSQDGISLIQTAEGALNETHSILQRMRELAVQSASDTNTDSDRTKLQEEVNQLVTELGRISETTEFNTQKLLDGSFSGTFQIGANEGHTLDLGINAMNAASLGLTSSVELVTKDISAATGAGKLLDGSYTFEGTSVKDANGNIVGTFATDTITLADTTTIQLDNVIAAGDTMVISNSGDAATLTKNLISGQSNTVLAPGDYTLVSNGTNLNLMKEDTVVGTMTAASGVITFTDGRASIDVSATFGIDAADIAAGYSFDVKGVDVSNRTQAEGAITAINNAIETVSSERSKLGAVQNRLEHTINNLGTSSENLTAAESRIRDVDMAKEMMDQTKNSILAQAAQAMLAQANQQPQGVLQLLR
jgi:flagellin